MSRYRHTFATVRNHSGYDGLKPKSSRGESSILKVSTSSVIVQWETTGFGALAVLPVRDSDIEKKIPAKLPFKVPLIEAYKSNIVDFAYNPFDESIIVTTDVGTMKVWKIPKDGLKETLRDPLAEITGKHSRRLNSLSFHPTASNLLVTTSREGEATFIDIQQGQECMSISTKHTDIIQSLSWDYDGKLFVTSSKDKKMKIVDPRAGKIEQEVEAHESSKGFLSIWLGKRSQILTNGFNKNGERKISIWDCRKLVAGPLNSDTLPPAPSVLQPFYDENTDIIFLAGRGDNSIRYYEIVDDSTYLHFLDQYTSPSNQTELAVFPKRIVDVSSCEVLRFAKLSKDRLEHIMFQIPRKGRDVSVFHEDLYQFVEAGIPALSAAEWLKGETKPPILIPPEQLRPKESVSIFEIDPSKRQSRLELKGDQKDAAAQPKPDNKTGGSGTLEGFHETLYDDGSRYKGNWKGGKQTGTGEFYCARDGSVYSGSWCDGQKHGIGKLHVKGNIEYVGEWNHGVRSSSGTYKLQDGLIFEGEWLPTGECKGKFKWPNGDIYEGTIKDGKKCGHGLLKFADGSTYNGEWKHDMREGYGEYVWVDGMRYCGKWKADKMHGEGILYIDKESYEGTWENGTLVDIR